MEKTIEKEIEADTLLGELQGLWDEQSVRIYDLCASAEARPQRLRRLWSVGTRRVRMAEYAAVVALDICVVAFVASVLPRREGFDEWIAMAGALLGLTAAVAAVMATVRIIRLVRGNPARQTMTPTMPVVRIDFLRRMATVSSAAVVLMLFVSKAPLGDGYGIATHGMDRADAVLNVDKVIELMA